MLSNFDEVMDKALKLGRVTISVAAAADKDILVAVKTAQKVGLAQAILVGDEAKIKSLAAEVGLGPDVRIVHEPDTDQAAHKAVSLVRQGEAQVLMKGLINTSNLCGLYWIRTRACVLGSSSATWLPFKSPVRRNCFLKQTAE